MPAIRIRIDRPSKAGSGPVATLHEYDDVGRRWQSVPGARTVWPAGLAPPDAPADPDNIEHKLTAPRVTELAQRSPVPPAVGDFLFALLARGKLGAAWNARRSNGPLRLQLQIDNDPALAAVRALPWERMRDDGGRFIALIRDAPFVRWTEPEGAALRADWPVRVLVVNAIRPGNAPGGAQRTDADRELLAIERLLASDAMRHDVEYDMLEHPSREALVEACRAGRPHVLHVVAHADSTPNGGRLLLWQPPGAGQPERDEPWPAADIRTQLQGIAPRLVFLNACGSAAPAAGSTAPLATLAQAFHQAGTVATIGMQGDVRGDLASRFAEAFYEAYLGGSAVDIDLAMQSARIAMAGAGGNEEEDADWAFAVLTRCVGEGEVLPYPPAPWAGGQADRFVARLPQRRETHEAVRCGDVPALRVSKHLAIISGASKSGKTWLADWAMQACRRNGMDVAVVSFNGADKVDWLDALRWIRDGSRPERGGAAGRQVPAAGWPLRPEHFRSFNWMLNRRLAGRATFDAPPDGGLAVADEGRALAAAGDRPETLVEDTFTAFRDALLHATAARDLVLMLDQVEGIDEASFNGPLMDGLLRPIALGSLPRVRMLLVMQQAHWEAARLEFERMASRPHVVHLPYFKRGDYERIARQLCLQMSGRLYEGIRDTGIMRSALPGFDEPREWNAEILASLRTILKAIADGQGLRT
jgi:CHAT domain